MNATTLTAHIIERINSLPTRPGTVPITVFENQLDYETLRPEDRPHTVAAHTALMHSIAENLRTEYNGAIRIVLVTLNASDYLRWLAETQQANTAATRASFIALSTRDRLPPTA